MASDLNVVALTGRLTRDSELKYANSGMAIARFTLAVNRKIKDANGQWVDTADFFDCSMFGKSAEGVNQYLLKGTHVAINAELRQERWEKDGQKQSKVTLVVNQLTLLGGSQNNQNNAQNQRTGQQTGKYPPKPQERSTEPPVSNGVEEFDESQIPF